MVEQSGGGKRNNNKPPTILTKEHRERPKEQSYDSHISKNHGGGRVHKKASIQQQLLSKLSVASEMAHSTPILDHQLQWVDKGVEFLTDNKDFCVVGVVGGQGVGKSTIASMLAGARPTGARRSYMFWPQSRDARETGVNQTFGVYMAVSTERFIFLDTQPLMSHSLLDNLMYSDRSVDDPDTQIEIQSLQRYVTVELLKVRFGYRTPTPVRDPIPTPSPEIQELNDTSKQSIRTRYLGHVTG
eukprot:sb/3468971/